MATLLFASFMNFIDVTVVNVALPSLQRNLGATSSEIEWVVAVYVLAFALGLLPFGRLGDMIGRRRMFLIGVGCFTLFSAICGLAPTVGTLIVARALQGLGGAMMMPQVMAIAQVMFPLQERGLAFSLFGLTAGLASVAGPLIGGVLVGADLFGLDWRPIFLVNIPIGIAAIAVGRILIPAMPGHPELKHDVLGIALAGASVLLLVYPLIEGRNHGWPAWIFGMLSLGIVGLVLFFFRQNSRARHDQTQLLPARLLTNGNFMLGAVICLVFFSGVVGFFMVFAVFLQSGFGLTPLQSGMTTVPFPGGVLVASLVAGRLGNRWLRQRIGGGALVMGVGMWLLRIAVANTGETAEEWQFFLPLAIAGIGMGVAVSALFQTPMLSVLSRDAGSGSGALQSFQQVGAALGIAIIGHIFFSTQAAALAFAGSPHRAYIASLEAALLYELGAFGLVALLVCFLRPPTPQQGATVEPPPVVIDA